MRNFNLGQNVAKKREEEAMKLSSSRFSSKHKPL